jgi:DNA-binding ferritin-like protein
LAAAEAEAKRIAQLRKEEAERLDDTERNDLIKKMTTVFATGDNEKIQNLLKDYNTKADDAKAALKKLNEAGSGATADEISAADTELVKAKKRIVELQQAYKREVDL